MAQLPQAELPSANGKSAHFLIDGVKVSYSAQPGIRLQTDHTCHGVPPPALRTWAVLKCHAAANRGSKHDCFALYAMSQVGWSLEQMLKTVQAYTQKLQTAHVLQSLADFHAGEHGLMPIIGVPVQRPDTKHYLQNAVVSYRKNHTARPPPKTPADKVRLHVKTWVRYTRPTRCRGGN